MVSSVARGQVEKNTTCVRTANSIACTVCRAGNFKITQAELLLPMAVTECLFLETVRNYCSHTAVYLI